MLKTNTIRAIILVILVSGFMLGITQLFLLRFEAGDVYPAYSTLRSDPLGSRAFYRGLENLRNISVQRNYQQLTNLIFARPSTVFYIGAHVFDSESVPKEWIETFDRLADGSGRLVLAFLPVEKKPANWRMASCAAHDTQKSDDKPSGSESGSKDAGNAEANQTKPSREATRPPISENDRQCVSLKEQWGITFAFADAPATEAVKTSEDRSTTDLKKLPQAISWHTSIFFDELDDSWQVIYTAEGRPVIVERPYGNGSLVLLADAFFMSNEALRSERYPELLAWTVGHNTSIVFDETHLGIRKQPGVLSLIKQYRFHWFVLAVVLLAILFVWKNSVYFVPPRESSHDGSGQDVYSNRDSTQGLISLLRRNISTRQLLPTCAREWRRTFQRHQRFSGPKDAPVESIFERIKTYSVQSNDPVDGYQRISKIISRGRR